MPINLKAICLQECHHTWAPRCLHIMAPQCRVKHHHDKSPEKLKKYFATYFDGLKCFRHVRSLVQLWHASLNVLRSGRSRSNRDEHVIHARFVHLHVQCICVFVIALHQACPRCPQCLQQVWRPPLRRPTPPTRSPPPLLPLSSLSSSSTTSSLSSLRPGRPLAGWAKVDRRK